MSNKLPKLPDLHYDLQLAEKQGVMLSYLNRNPHKTWVKEHPIAKTKVNGKTVPVKYIGIAKVEDMLDKLFQQWRVEVLQIQPMFNSICCTVRVHYLSPITGEWSYHDGVGAVAVQTDAGANASDLGAIKSNAIQLAAPASKSYALKNAVKHLGNVFGRNLNREFDEEYQPVYTTVNRGDESERNRLITWLKSPELTFANTVTIRESDNFHKYLEDAEVIELLTKREQEL